MAVSNVVAVPVTGDVAVSAVPCSYLGFTLRETAGAAAVVRIFDDPDSANGTLLDTVALAANASLSKHYGPQGIRAQQGVWFELVSGAVEGSVRIG